MWIIDSELAPNSYSLAHGFLGCHNSSKAVYTHSNTRGELSQVFSTVRKSYQTYLNRHWKTRELFSTDAVQPGGSCAQNSACSAGSQVVLMMADNSSPNRSRLIRVSLYLSASQCGIVKRLRFTLEQLSWRGGMEQSTWDAGWL